MQLRIDEEFKKIIPALRDEEYGALEQSILDEGCRDAIIAWDGVIIDGHNRYEICTKHDIDFEISEKVFENKDYAKIWIIQNQCARRNIVLLQKVELKKLEKEILLKIGREKQKEAGEVGGKTGGRGREKNRGLSTIDKPLSESHNTQKIIAEELNCSTGTLAKAEIVIKKATPEQKNKIYKNESSINKVYNEIRKEERDKKTEQQKQDIIENKLSALDGLYDVISIDPPWPYGRKYDPETSRVASPYPEMSIDEITNIKLPASDDSIIFLWTTHKFLPDSFKILENWGFDYKATLVWNKEKIGMGSWFRMQCEFCLFAIKGKPLWDNKTEIDIISEKRREHSRKPEAFYSLVDKLCIGRKLEYFSRTKRNGWDVFGNDTEKFNV